MLEFIKVRHPDQIESLLQAYDSEVDTWIVSDLKSKQEVQNLALARYGHYCDDAILRVNDFWRLWIRRLDPTLQVVSADFIKSLVQQFVDDHGVSLQIAETEVSTLNKALQEFAPILLHPQSDEVLQEWVQQQRQPKSWWRWYQASSICMNHIVNTRRCLDAQWSAAYLQSLDHKNFRWPRKIYVDLGSEMSSLEMGLFKILSQHQTVVVIMPEPVWKEKFPYLLNTYRENTGYGSILEAAENINQSSGKKKSEPQFLRLSTQLSEVKFAVSQVRQWAEKDQIKLAEMAIIAADVEVYWPALQYYLEEEGLPHRKDVIAQLNSLGPVQSLLAQLKSHSDDVAWDSLERSWFSVENSESLNFEKFKSLFYQLYDQDDLGRDSRIKNLFYRQIDFTMAVERDEFLAFLVKVWMRLPATQQLPDIFEIIFKDFLTQSLNIKMRFSRWVSFLKNRLSRKELKVQSMSSHDGLRILPLMSAHLSDSTHRIYLGLNDEYYHRKQTSLMSLADSVALKNQFDLALDYSEESFLDFNLRWQSLKREQNFIYTSAHVGFAAEPLSGSLFFIENSPQSDVSTPDRIRFDERQMELSSILTNTGAAERRPEGGFAALRLQQDLNGYCQPVPHAVFRQLSVSDVENYSQCAFKLLASKGFRLGDLPQLSLDLDPRQKGSLVHELFEYCVLLMRESRYTQAAIEQFLDAKKNESNLYFGQEALWQRQKNKFLLLADRFYKFEEERLRLFEIETEKKYQLYFDTAESRWSAQSNDSASIGFSVRIDRIDRHREKKYRIIYDYKNSGGELKNHDKWLSERSFQMLLYMKAIEQNETDRVVGGALYYEYKHFNVKKGILDSEIAASDFSMTKKNKCQIGAEAREQLDQDFTELMAAILGQLVQFRFDNTPYDREKCKKCDWRKLCRAPHLM